MEPRWRLRENFWDILDQISNHLVSKKTRRRTSRIGNWISKHSKPVVPFDLDASLNMNDISVNTNTGKIMSGISLIAQILSSSDNINKARERIQEVTKGKKIIIFIDDLDRLEGKQIINILRVIDAFSNYGGMTFVLPFDRKYVSSAVGDYLPSNESGSEYIDKVIQIPITLPLLTRKQIDKVFIDRLSKMLASFDITIDGDEISRFQKMYFYGVNNYITSPRDVNTTLNSLKFRVPISKGELNIVDTIILEIVRLYDWKLYDIIHNNFELFTTPISIYSNRSSEEKAEKKKNVENTMNGSELQLSIIRYLFPIVDNLYYNMISYDDSTNLRKQQRIASNYYFDSFFSYLDNDDSISNRKIVKMIELSTDGKALREYMSKLINSNNFNNAIDLINDRSNSIQNKLEFCKALFDLVDNFDNKFDSTGLGLSRFDKLIDYIDDFLENSETILNDYISLLDYEYDKNRIESIPLLIREVVLYSEKEKHGKKINLNSDEVNEYKIHAREAIQKIANKDQISVTPAENNTTLFYLYWFEFGGAEDLSVYIQKRVRKADQVVDFISQFLGRTTQLGKNDYHRMDLNKATVERVSNYVNLDYLYKLLMDDEKYKDIGVSTDKNLHMLENRMDTGSEKNDLSKVGNEQNQEFRDIIASQFIYYYLKDDKQSERENVNLDK